MAPRKKTGRSTAEAAYANLLKENTALVGDVGETWSAFVADLEDAAASRERYEEARAAAVKNGAVTNDQLDQMGYKKTTKTVVLQARTSTEPKTDSAATAGHLTDQQINGAPAGSALTSAGVANLVGHS